MGKFIQMCIRDRAYRDVRENRYHDEDDGDDNPEPGILNEEFLFLNLLSDHEEGGDGSDDEQYSKICLLYTSRCV